MVSVIVQWISLANIRYIGLSDVVGTEEAGADARPIPMLTADARQKQAAAHRDSSKLESVTA
jgi:hypothetical protein